MAIQIPNPGTGNGATGDNEFVLWSKVKDNFSDQTHAASRLVGKTNGTIPQYTGEGISSTGIGGAAKTLVAATANDIITELYDIGGCVFRTSSFASPIAYGYGNGMFLPAIDTYSGFSVSHTGLGIRFFADLSSNKISPVIYELWTSRNATKDPNGFLKGASPIAEIYSDKMDLNDDAEQQGGITFEKLGIGDYLVKGSLGFAQEGWHIETPKDANGNVLVAVIYEQLANNDLSIKTYAKKFDDETGDIVANLLKPRDIPVGRFISLRLHELPKEPPVMPNNIQNEEIVELDK